MVNIINGFLKNIKLHSQKFCGIPQHRIPYNSAETSGDNKPQMSTPDDNLWPQMTNAIFGVGPNLACFFVITFF
jgi:hypothetical protein